MKTFSIGTIAQPAQSLPGLKTTARAFVIAMIALAPALVAAQDNISSEYLLPENTKAWVSVPDADLLKSALEKTRFGQMTEDPEVKPFIDDLVRQFRGFLDQQNIQFGIKLADIEAVKSGEICLAGVLRPPVAGAEDAIPDHAIVLLVDVLDSMEPARELLDRVADEMQKRGATLEAIKIGEIEANKLTLQHPVGLRNRQHAFQSIIGRWLVACDNEAVFRDIVGELTGTAVDTETHLASNPVFQAITEKTRPDAAHGPAHIRWFIEPLGYMNLAQSIADSKNAGKSLRNDYINILNDEGFAAIRGIGGSASFATGKHELIHRTFIYAPHSENEPFQRGAQILDFRNRDGSALDPPAWIPENAASYLTLTWDLGNALENVGYIADSVAGTPGSWKRTLDGYRNDPNGPRVDLRRVAQLLENRLTVVSVTSLPIDDSSERILFGIRILDDVPFVEDSVYRFVKNKAQVLDHDGTRILVIDTSDEYDGPDVEINGDFLDSEFGSDPGEAEEEFKKPKPLFEQQVIAIKDNILLIGNNVDQVKSVISDMASEPGKRLTAAEDYQRIHEALSELAGDMAPSFRQFGRMDLSIRPNYEMMRAGRMAQSKTLLAQIINRAYEDDKANEGTVRKQEIDGSKMPEDFEGKVARYFGPTGLVVHTTDEGWVITGCILAKQQSTSAATTQVEEETGAGTRTDADKLSDK